MQARSTKVRDQARRRRTGRPPKLTKPQIDLVRRLALEHPEATIRELIGLLAEHTGLRLSPTTLYKYLALAGIRRAPRPQAVSPGPAEPTGAAAASPDSSGAPVRYGYTQQHRDQGDPSRYPSSLTDPEWAMMADLFPAHRPGKPPKYPRRQIMDAILYVHRTGCQWRMLPKEFPPWQDVYAHFRRWTDRGLFETMQDRLRALWRKIDGRDPQPTAAVLDSQSVKTSPQGGPKGFDAAKKVKGRKRHLVVDVLGLVLAVLVLPANIQDRDGAQPVVAAAMAKCPGLKKLFVDAAFGGECAQQLRHLFALDVEVVRPPRAQGAWADSALPSQPAPNPAQGAPFPILPRRWVIERTNAWVERPRRLSKDYDRRLDVSAAWIWLSQVRLLLRRIVYWVLNI